MGSAAARAAHDGPPLPEDPSVVAAAPREAPALPSLASILDGAGVAWLQLRPGDTPGSADPAHADDDLLIAPADMARAEQVLRRAGFVELPAPGRGSHRFWWAYDGATGGWTKLDVVTTLGYGPLQALATDAATGLLARRARRGGMPVPAPDDAFWSLLLHDVFDKRAIPDDHLRSLRGNVSAARTAHPLAALLAAACPPGLGPDRIIDLIRADDRAELDQLVPRIGRAWGRVQPLAGRSRLLERKVRRRLASLGLPPRRGLSVALLGPDGAGKSSLLGRLPQALPMPVETIYFGLYGARVPAGRWGSGLLLRLLLAWRTDLRAGWARARGRLVVFDRHPIETDRVDHGGPRTRWRRGLIARAVRRPDLILVLDAPADVLASRRPEHDRDALGRQQLTYRRLADRFVGSQLVDASADPEAVLRTVIAAIWRAVGQRRRW